MATLFRPRNRPSFYHRAVIPRRLRPYFKGRAQLWRSLSTNDRDDATLKALAWKTRAQRLFLTLKREGAHMTPAEIERLIAQWMDSELEESEDYRALHRLNDDQREIMVDETIERLEETEQALAGNHYEYVAGDVDAMLKESGMPLLAHDSLAFKRCCRAFLLAKQDMLTTEIERWQGKYVKGRVAAAPAMPMVKAPVVPAGPLFSIVVDKFLAETPRAARSAKPLKVEFLKFVSLIGGDRPITAITKGDCRQYKEHLLNDRKLSQMTTAKHLSAGAAVYDWAKLQGYVSGENPFKGLAPSKKIIRKTMTKRRPFSEEELLTVFGSREFLTQRDANAARYWIPLLCLFQVCRREEGAQLAVADIQEDQGVPFVRVNDDEKLGQSLKNEGSRRRVPIHSSLIKLGFLDYVQQMKQAGHVRLFPKLTKGNSGYADPVGKWFGRLVTKLGILDEAVVLHSLRHGGISKLTGAGCPHNVCEMLAGHAAAGVHGQVYVHREGVPLSLLREGLERLRYDEVVKALQRG
jgi:integrase